jgi:hypothetical protein
MAKLSHRRRPTVGWRFQFNLKWSDGPWVSQWWFWVHSGEESAFDALKRIKSTFLPEAGAEGRVIWRGPDGRA